MQRTPVSIVQSTNESPASANKAALQLFNGGEDEDQEEDNERKEEREDGALESTLQTLKEFVTRTLYTDRSEALVAFAHVLEENAGQDARGTLTQMLTADDAHELKGSWSKEFLRIVIKAPTQRNKVMSFFSKVCSAFEAMSLDFCVILSQLEERNLSTNAYYDVDFDGFSEIIKKADGATTHPPERVLARKIVLTNMIGAISEGILRAGALYVLSDIAPSRSPVVVPPASSESFDDLTALLERKLGSVMTHVNARVEDLAERHDKESNLSRQSLEILRENQHDTQLQLTSLMSMVSKLGVLLEPTPQQAASAVKGQVKRYGEEMKAGLKPFVPRSLASSSSKFSEAALESAHEKKAATMAESEVLHSLTTNTKGNNATAYVDYNDCFQRGLQLSAASSSTSARFSTSSNALIDASKAGILLLPGFALVINSSASKLGAKDKIGRTIVTNAAQSTHFVREVSHIASWESNSAKDYIPLSSITMKFPKSLFHMSRFFSQQIDFLKNGVLHTLGPFDDEGMLTLIESCAATFMSNMCEAAAMLLDGVKTPCMSVDGHWRGLLQLFWHQYSRAFSSLRQDCHSVFFPEALNQGFEDNRDILFRDYNWSTQLTCELANLMHLQCWRCSSDVMHQSCLSVECKKKRAEEEPIHVFAGKGTSGAGGAKVATCRMFKG